MEDQPGLSFDITKRHNITNYDLFNRGVKYVVALDEFASGNVNGVKIMYLADFLLKSEY